MGVYYPYFRGKQYELVTIRESASLLTESEFVPIIEPVRESLRGLQRTLTELNETRCESIVILNPKVGDLIGRSREIQDCVAGFDCAGVGLIGDVRTSPRKLATLCKDHLREKKVTIVHAGIGDARILATQLGSHLGEIRHVFLEPKCGKLYRRHFKGADRALIRDGFDRKTNRDYPPYERFSELHLTFDDEGMDGFGDFLIVGDEYSETGGPAYAVAIHITAIDENKDEEMWVFHFKSDRVDTPKDPAGKFLEALQHLYNEVTKPNSPIKRTSAVDEFIRLHSSRHFPGLGYVKKLSMKHHLETLSGFLSA